MTNKNYLFTSESVSEGHPDKVADQISDAILDAILENDSKGRVACETMVKNNVAIIAGEITTETWIDLDKVVRDQVKNIGYMDGDLGFDAHSLTVIPIITTQSHDIASGIDHGKDLDIGAGDQGLVFGYATNETPELMPAPIMYAHKMMIRHSELRKQSKLPWLRPDAKCQVTVEYVNDQPKRIDTVILSTQHSPDVTNETIRESMIEEVIKGVVPAEMLVDTQYMINTSGKFVLGGPQADCGLTGRKVIVDTYGGTCRHGGGCFSGKDPTKIDRSGAYMARYIAKQIVAAEIAEKCEIQIAYAIGVSKPVSLYVNTFGTGRIPDREIEKIVSTKYDLRPGAIIQKLDLLRPIYKETAACGHFGKLNKNFRWEEVNKEELANYIF